MPLCAFAEQLQIGHYALVPVLAVAIVVVVIFAITTPLMVHTVVGPIFDRRRRGRNDAVVFEDYCATGTIHRFHAINRRVPSDPRCKLCYVPFGGFGKVLGVRPSRKNPNFCRGCFEAVPEGGHERPVGVFFADLRNFTSWSAERPPEEVANALADFYRIATDALMAHDAIIDKFVGDGVVALFLADMPTLGDRTCDEMMAAALETVEATRARSVLPGVGVGLHFGTAWVGNVGEGEMKDFTALGDVVNVASRLQSCAAPGQIVVSEEAFNRLHAPVEATSESFTVKGKDEPLAARVVALTA